MTDITVCYVTSSVSVVTLLGAVTHRDTNVQQWLDLRLTLSVDVFSRLLRLLRDVGKMLRRPRNVTFCFLYRFDTLSSFPLFFGWPSINGLVSNRGCRAEQTAPRDQEHGQTGPRNWRAASWESEPRCGEGHSERPAGQRSDPERPGHCE